jgi:hypothetical protein
MAYIKTQMCAVGHIGDRPADLPFKQTQKTNNGMAVMTNFKNSIARGALLAVLAASATVTATGSFAAPGYDGMRSVSIVTQKGDCDAGYRYPVRISNGSLVNAGGSAIEINGKVGSTGAITVSVSAAGKTANGAGHLAGNNGAGSWTGGSCSGVWTAERRAS